jgi:hypothetical protein
MGEHLSSKAGYAALDEGKEALAAPEVAQGSGHPPVGDDRNRMDSPRQPLGSRCSKLMFGANR